VDLKPEYRVLQVFSSLGMGGAETWMLAMLRHLDRIKDDLPFRIKIDICLTSGYQGYFDEEAASLGAQLYYLTYSRKDCFSFICEFRKILAKGCYHAIHDHQDYTAGLHFLFGTGQLPSVRIAHVHNPYIHIQNYSSSLFRKLIILIGKSILSRKATHIIGTSSKILFDYGFDNTQFRKVKIGPVYCGFDVNCFVGDYSQCHHDICNEFSWDKNSKILLFVGRLNGSLNHKNPKFALQIARLCIKNDPSVKLLVVGDGEEAKKQFQDIVNDWGLQGSLLFLGLRSDVPRLMAGTDLLLFPSVGEGLGMVAVEAQSAGLRVLASDAVPIECMVIPEIVKFKPLADSSDEWAKESLRLMNLSRPNRSVCNKLIRKSPFSIENSMERLLNIYFSNISNS